MYSKLILCFFLVFIVIQLCACSFISNNIDSSDSNYEELYEEQLLEYKALITKNEALKKENVVLSNRLSEVSYKLVDVNERYKNVTKAVILTKNLSDLVNIKDLDNSIIIDLKYAQKDNFTGKIVYDANVCLLKREAAEKLINANLDLQKMGYRIKVWDAYRPYYVQQILWDSTDNKTYVADPQKGSRHNRGCAVDVTLVDKDGLEVEMPSDFDDFSLRASRTSKMSSKAAENLAILTNAMKKHGFTTINSEWWHYDYKNWQQHSILNYPLSLFDE